MENNKPDGKTVTESADKVWDKMRSEGHYELATPACEDYWKDGFNIASQFNRQTVTDSEINWIELESEISDMLYESNGTASGTYYVMEHLKKKYASRFSPQSSGKSEVFKDEQLKQE